MGKGREGPATRRALGAAGFVVTVVAGLATAVAASTPAGAATVPPPAVLFRPLAPGFGAATLTRVGTDTFAMSASGGTVTVDGNSDVVGANNRAVFWPAGQVPAGKQQSCVSFAAKSGRVVQQGVALRVWQARNGATRAITVTNNVYTTTSSPATWLFNVHVWRSNQDPAYRLVTTFDLGPVFADNGTPRPLPWRVCARVQGRLLRVEAWRTDEPTPPWNDTVHGGSVKLPPGFGHAGQAGWYAGHLYAGDRAVFSGLAAGTPTSTPG